MNAVPQIGDIKPAAGRGRNAKIFAACVDCGKARWVELVISSLHPRRLRCRACAAQRNKLRIGSLSSNWKGGICSNVAEYKRQYERTHAHLRPVIDHRWRAKKVGSVGEFSAEQWEDTKEKQGYRCAKCNQPEPLIKLTVDHIIPLRHGGANTIDNIQALCRSCNASKFQREERYALI